ncbi:MAG: transcription initiation factor IIB [Nitrosopumilales archaeon CG_4_9_14_0_2_um_filter_34_16]|nr:MAG: transcription initiation factor IIB [Nitrosopumilales archaeon CG_4_9_14_0_2_um_filter_34_16]
MVRVPISQKISFKGKNSSCMDSVTVTDVETGEMICQKCGIVLQDTNSFDIIDNTLPKSINVDQVDNRSLLRFHDMGLATVIDKFNHDSKGKPIAYKIRQDMHRMRLWDSRSHAKNASERNLRSALSEMEKLKEKLSLSDAIMERSAYLYRKAAKAQLVRGRKINGILGACVYIACREMDVSRTIIDISKNLQESRSSIAKNYRMLFNHLKISVSVQDPIKCIVKIANNLEIPENTTREAICILDTLKERRLTAGKKPDAVAATIIYMACIKTGISLSQQKISKVSGITGVTIRNRYNDYLKYVDLF